MPITKQSYKINDNGNTRAGLQFTPSLGVNEKAALLIVLHGTGQSGIKDKDGNGVLDDAVVNKLYEWKPPIYIAQQNNKFEFTSPLTGQVVKFFVLALQGVSGWTVYAPEVAYVVKEFLKTNPVDPNLVGICGLSAGGAETWAAVGGVDAALYCFGFPLSSPTILASEVNWSRLTARIQAYHGKQDTGQTDYGNSLRMVGEVNAVKKGFANLVTTNDGHNGWDVWYALTNKQPYTINGVVLQLTPYELMLACSKESTFRFVGAGSPNTIPTTMPASPKLKITVTGTTITCDPTGSTGINSWDLKLIDENGLYFKPDWMGATSGNSNPTFLPTANNVRKGKGSVVFTCQPGNIITQFPFDIGGLTQPPPPLPIKTAIAIIPNAKTGNTTYVYDDDTTDKRLSQ